MTGRSSASVRGRRPALAVLLVALLVLAACGGDGGATATEPSTPSPEAGATEAGDADAAAFPVTIEHAFGVTELTERPVRVVTLGYGEADIVAALGVVPVAVNTFGARDGAPPPWLVEEVDGAEVELLSLVDGIPFEQIAALEPDVILGLASDIDQADFELLSQVAPTVAYQTGPFQDSWQDASVAAGRALGEEERARALVEEVEADIAAAAAARPELAGRTVSVALAISPDQVGVLNSPEENTVRLLTQLGMELAPAVAALEVGPTGYSALLSPEQVGALDADVLALYAITDEAREALLSNAVFGALDVVGRDDVLPIEPDVWVALRTPTVLAIPYALEQLADPLAAAVAD